jgi:hypothetical protein
MYIKTCSSPIMYLFFSYLRLVLGKDPDPDMVRHQNLILIRIQIGINKNCAYPHREVLFVCPLGHICYYVTCAESGEKLVFTGDTLFLGGCGRFFEGQSYRPNNYKDTKP